MPYLIDGHNLIPKLGMRLDSPDDEQELVAILQEFCRMARRDVEVYFDGAPAAQAGTRSLGRLTAHFVRLGSSADAAIRSRLKKMGRSAKNWTVVTSDRQVQAEARAAQSEVISSESFATLLRRARASAPKGTDLREPTSEEVDEWLRIFQNPKQE
jgi:predicted RNA-binding protein with PIN domain